LRYGGGAVTSIQAQRRDEEWHAQDADDVLRTFETHPTGLSDREAEARLAAHGPNRLPETAGPSAVGLLLAQNYGRRPRPCPDAGRPAGA